VAERVEARFIGDRVITIAYQLPPSLRRVVASLDKALYDDYLCLVTSNKQKIKW